MPVVLSLPFVRIKFGREREGYNGSVSDVEMVTPMRLICKPLFLSIAAFETSPKQQMQWSKEGAHLLLQTRVRTLNGELAGIFKRWYPGLDMKAEAIPLAA